MNLKINGKEYKIKYTLRALIIFEKITDKTFGLSTLTDQIIFLYSLILANNKDAVLKFEDLIDAIDADQSILQNYLGFLENQKEKDAALNNGEAVDDKKKE